jgi:DNA-binding MarR family transcriptional regulator
MPVDLPTLTIARIARLLENSGPTEISLPQYRVLGLLSSGDERATQLAARLSVAKPTLTALVDSLVERGFIARHTLDGDRRSVSMSITPAGRTALRRTANGLRDALDDVIGRCPHPDAVLVALDELRQALDARWQAKVAESDAVKPRVGAVPS